MHAVAGYLETRRRHVKSWRRRYFTFADGMLACKKTEGTAAKVIDEDRVFDVLFWSGRPHGLCLRLRSGRLLFLAARSEDDATRWHDVVESYLRQQQRIEDLRRILCR
ncbi:hypothetical protein BBJ28_00010853, partial [Nothophytophthora sp. Chile5]